MHIWVLMTTHGRVLLGDKKTLTLTEAEGTIFAAVLWHQQTMHNEYLFLAQRYSQVHLVQRFSGTAFYY